MRIDSVPMPLPAGLVDTSFSFIQVGLNALVLSAVMDRVEVPVCTEERRMKGGVFSEPGTPGLTGVQGIFQQISEKHAQFRLWDDRGIGQLNVDVKLDSGAFPPYLHRRKEWQLSA